MEKIKKKTKINLKNTGQTGFKKLRSSEKRKKGKNKKQKTAFFRVLN